MIFQDALRSLRKDAGRAFFYWLTFVLTAMFIFLFLNIAMSEAVGVTFVNTANTDIATNVAMILIVICVVEILFANDFYVRSKARELAVRLVCGATYMQLAQYLLIQTFILLAAAIPFGIIASLMLIPLINTVLHHVILSSFTVAIVPKAVILTAVILIGVIFWATYLNLAFAYRHSAAGMMNETSLKLQGSSMVNTGKPLSRIRQILAVVLTVVPLVLFYVNPDGIILSSLIGLIGISGILTRILIPLLSDYIDRKKPDQPMIMAGVGFMRTDIAILKWNILLLLITSIFLASVLISASDPQEIMLVLLSYIVMNVMLSLAIMFRYSTELQSRFRYYRSLEQIGFMHENQKSIIRLEVTGLYGIILAVMLLYIGNIFLALVLDHRMSAANAGMLTVFYLIPLILCCLLTMHYYSRAVLLQPVKEGQAGGR